MKITRWNKWFFGGTADDRWFISWRDAFVKFIDMTSMWYFIIISMLVMVLLTIVCWMLAGV